MIYYIRNRDYHNEMDDPSGGWRLHTTVPCRHRQQLSKEATPIWRLPVCTQSANPDTLIHKSCPLLTATGPVTRGSRHTYKSQITFPYCKSSCRYKITSLAIATSRMILNTNSHEEERIKHHLHRPRTSIGLCSVPPQWW